MNKRETKQCPEREKRKRLSSLTSLCLVALILFALAGGCAQSELTDVVVPSGGGISPNPDIEILPSGEPTDESTPPEEEPTPTPTPTPTPPPIYDLPDEELVDYTGPVEHIFVHPLIAYPTRAFDGSKFGDNMDDWFVTVSEYKKILQSLWEKNFILVDINDCFEEYTDDNGNVRMRKAKLRLPPGKKPIVFSYDDVNYYEYMRQYGTVNRLVFDEQGNIADESVDMDGNTIITRELDVVTVMDTFVEEHPDFSWRGAKGCIGVTGFDGILGYHVQADSPNRESEIEALKPIIQRLKETGWTFASHSYGHPHFASISYEKLKSDTDKWLDQVGSLVGETKILLYPYGEAVPEGSDKMKYLEKSGFRVLCTVGINPYVKASASTNTILYERRHPDGTTLRHGRKRYMDLYDCKEVIDLDVRPNRPYDFDIS